MKDKTFEYKATYYGFIGILLITITSLFSCAKQTPTPQTVIPFGATWEGYYNQVAGNVCPLTDSVYIRVDVNNKIAITSFDYWSCGQDILGTYNSTTNSISIINGTFIRPGSSIIDTVNTVGYIRGDTITFYNVRYNFNPSLNLTYKYVKY